MKSLIFISIICTFTSIYPVFSQVDSSYSHVDVEIFSEEKTIKTSYFATWSEYALVEFVNTWKSEKKRQSEKEKAQAKINMVRNTYEAYSTYPEYIIDGWHNVIITDNLTYCNEAKVYVQNNRIEKLVIKNYLPVDVKGIGEIKDGKNLINIIGSEGVSQVYFLYDLDSPQLASKPEEPGYLCFWTDLKRNYDHVKVYLNDEFQGELTGRFDDPSCFQRGMICLILPAGLHNFKALGRGTIDWEGNLILKSNQCLKVRLGK